MIAARVAEMGTRPLATQTIMSGENTRTTIAMAALAAAGVSP